MKIVVIEDDEKIAQNACMLLEDAGCKVSRARTGGEGLKLAEEKQPETMLVDIGLPDMDGYEVAKTIRKNGPMDILLIAISGYGHEEAQIKAHESGFDYHIAKPANFEEILALIAGKR